MVNIIVADDHCMITAGLKVILENRAAVRDFTQVSNCNELMKQLGREAYSHLILDLLFPDGNSLEILPNIHTLYRSLHIMVFSMQPIAIIAPVLQPFGVRYVVSKAASEEEIIRNLIDFVNNREPVVSRTRQYTPSPFAKLANRELQVLSYILKGFSTAEIGRELNLAMNTISTMKSRIFEKTATERVSELIQLAQLHNIH